MIEQSTMQGTIATSCHLNGQHGMAANTRFSGIGDAMSVSFEGASRTVLTFFLGDNLETASFASDSSHLKPM